MKLEYPLTPYTKVNSEWIKDLNVRLDTIKLSKEYTGWTLFDTNHSNIFLDLSPRVMEIQINEWDLIKLKSFAQQRKLHTTEEILAKSATDKGLISKIYKKLIQLNIIEQPNQKISTRSN